MKWKYFAVAQDDLRAKAHVIDNVNVGAQQHTLSRKLLSEFSEAGGKALVIAFESLDLDYPHLYKFATYRNGQSDPVGTDPSAWTDAPRWGLVEFIDKWLQKSRDAVVLCENWLANREEATRGVANGSWESRILCFGTNEVYHILTSEDCGNGAAIEATLRESQYQWATGVCSRCADLPHGDIPSEAFFDGIVDSVEHIFVPALDEEGFVVWSPQAANGDGAANGGSKWGQVQLVTNESNGAANGDGSN